MQWKRQKGETNGLFDGGIGNLTEDADMESFVMAIHGYSNAEWGLEVCLQLKSKLGGHGYAVIHHYATYRSSDFHAPGSPLNLTKLGMSCATSAHVFPLVGDMQDPWSFADDQLWRKRTRQPCIETTASLVCCVDAGLD